MSENEQRGYEMAKGAARYLAECVALGLVGWLLFGVLRNACDIGVDNSDADGWHRSGLSVHCDAKTGVEYLSDGKGGLVVRAKISCANAAQ